MAEKARMWAVVSDNKGTLNDRKRHVYPWMELAMPDFQTQYVTPWPVLNSRPIINVCSIGHTCLTHSYLIEHTDHPKCTNCNQLLSVRHILPECSCTAGVWIQGTVIVCDGYKARSDFGVLMWWVRSCAVILQSVKVCSFFDCKCDSFYMVMFFEVKVILGNVEVSYTFGSFLHVGHIAVEIDAIISVFVTVFSLVNLI